MQLTFTRPVSVRLNEKTVKNVFLPSHKALSGTFLTFFLLLLMQIGYGQGVTAIYTDYGGFWTSSSTSINTVKPDNSHNLLAFTWNGTTYSTGVDDALLTTQGVTYSSGNFRAFPVNSVPNTAGGSYFVMLGQLYDGLNGAVDNSTTAPFSSTPTGAELAAFLTDGKKGLDLGTGLANIPAGSSIRFNLSTNGITAGAINDGIPDILISQLASPTSTSPDYLKFVDVNGNTVGNVVSITTSSLPVLGNWMADFYNLNSTQTTSSFINSSRPIAFYATDLSTFGITAANYSSVVALVYQPNGTSDPGFIAFNEPAISVATRLSLLSQPTQYQTAVTLASPITVQVEDGLGQAILQSGIPVTVSLQSGTASLGGTLTELTDASGIATFSNISITGSTTVKLAFSSASLDPAISADLTTQSTLPLVWSSFRAYAQSAQVQLVWQTYLEQGTQDYRIWRSSDGKDWTSLGYVAAAGSSLNLQTYHFTDGNPGSGQLYYRIEQRDLNGQSSFSKTVNIAFDPQQTLLTILSNPVRTGQLSFRLSQPAVLTIIGQNGARMLQQSFAAGTHSLDLSPLMPGTYIIAGAGPAQRFILIR